jgi:DNA adenine methylase
VAVSDVTRPVLRWHGGKFLLAERIMAFFPRHRCYTEVFGGAFSVGMLKPRVHAEIYNDLDDQVVGLFRVLQDLEKSARLIELLRLTPFARREFQLAYEVTEDPIEAARRLVIRSFMGFGSNAHSCAAKGHRSTGFRSNSNRSGTTPAHDWVNYPDALPALIARIKGVVIESRDAIEVLRRHDSTRTLHYVDPPYLQETRRREYMYRHELTRAGHIHLLAALKKLTGMVVLSGYPSDLYDARLKGWARYELPAYADGARARTEVLWLNPACAAALKHESAGRGTPLFPYLESAAAAQ